MAVNELEHPRWEENFWGRGLEPGSFFDKGSASPALIDLIARKEIPNGRALIPGCGRGYDVVALCTADRQVLGIDISPTGVEAARAHLSVESRANNILTSQAKIEMQNFFDLDENAKFDFIYDYTFLCALDPSVRSLWAAKMSALVKPGGELLTLIYPIGNRIGGPPFKVSLDMFPELLGTVGFSCKQLELLPVELCHPGRDGSGEEKNMSGIGRWIREQD